jgi:hypothetical protein
MLKKLALLISLGSACLSAQDTWKPLAFLIGTWEGRTAGGTTGTYSFQPELHDHILARHSINPACKDCHSDLLYVYQDLPNQSYKAIYFDNEGHVIHYDVTTPTPTLAVFLSDPSQPGPQYRLTYELKDSTMHGKFQIRMPGQTEFKSYLEWSGAKMR